MLEGKVIEVISQYEVIINLGARDYVQKGTRFQIDRNFPLILIDPDTEETLGYFYTSKFNQKRGNDIVVVSKVENKYSVAESPFPPMFGIESCKLAKGIHRGCKVSQLER